MWEIFTIFAQKLEYRAITAAGKSWCMPDHDCEMKITARELAALTGGVVEGNPDAEVHTFAKIEEAGVGSLTFLANPKYTGYLYDTQASVALVSAGFEAERELPVGLTLLRVQDPYATLAQLMSVVQSHVEAPRGVEQPCFIAEGVEVPEDAYIGAFAYVGKGARLGKGVRIYPQCYVGDGVSVGDDTIMYAGVRVYPGCVIGNRCVLHSGAVIGADGFGFAPTPEGYQKIPQMGIVEIADDVEVGANTTIDRATMGATRIGRGTKLDNLIQVAHNVTIGENNAFAAQCGMAGSSHIGDWNMFGGQVGLAGHIRIGSRNRVGAQSGLHRNTGDDCRLMGTPAIDARDFARLQVYLRNFPELIAAVKNLRNNQ